MSPLRWPESRARIGIWRVSRTLALLFIYRVGVGFATHGSDMYLGPCAHGGSNPGNETRVLYRDTRRLPSWTGARSTQQFGESSRTKVSLSSSMRRLPEQCCQRWRAISKAAFAGGSEPI